jgi:HD-like signal output (HDOD) protein
MLRKSETKLEHLRLLARRSGNLNVSTAQAVKVLDLVRRNATAVEIEAAVQLSPQLAINLVKLASSPAYGAMEISSVKFAIELLGWRELESLMVTLIVSSLAQASKDAQIIDGEKLRQRSLVQAFVSRALAKSHAPMHADEIYTAGLFLDAGYLLLGIHHPVLLLNLKRTCERTPGLDLLEAETEILGFTHAQLSAVMAEEFKLSPIVVECLRFHHDPIGATADAQTPADICCIASGLADGLELDLIEGLPRIGYDNFACRRLAIDPETLGRTVEVLTNKALVVAETLGATARAA